MVNLTKADRVILCELDCNSRQSLSSIGKKVRLKKESVHYRIRQLEKKGVILGYRTIVSLAKRGKMHVEMFLRFHNVTVPLRNEMIAFFTRLPEVIDLALCKGSWDMLIGIVVNDINELNTLKNRIFDNFTIYIASSSLSISIETYFFGRKYLVGKDIHMTQHIDTQGDERTDEIDERILSILAQDARQSLLDIAKQIGSSPKVISYRIKKMERSGIIQKYTAALNMEMLETTTYKLLIRLKECSHRKRFIEYFHRQPNTVNVREVLADWNIEPTFEVGSQEQFHRIVKEIEDLFGESIMSHTSLMLDQIYKTSYYS